MYQVVDLNTDLSECISPPFFTHHCRLIDGALAGVAVARALPADGDVSEAVEVLSQGQLVQEVVGSGLTSNGFHIKEMCHRHHITTSSATKRALGCVHSQIHGGENNYLFSHLILRTHPQSLHSDANEPCEGEVDEGARGSRRPGSPIHQTELLDNITINFLTYNSISP